MSVDSKIRKKIKNLDASFYIRDNIVFLEGKVKGYKEWVDVGLKIGKIRSVEGVVNNIVWNKTDAAGYVKRMKKRKQVFEKQKKKSAGEYDIAVVGGGVIGCFIARELSKYADRVVLFEKGSDIGLGATRANNGMIHPGVSPSYNTLKRKLNIEGNVLYDKVCEELDVGFKRVGSLILITPKSLESYRKKIPGFLYGFIVHRVLPFLVKMKGGRNGVQGIRILRKKRLFEVEPRVTCESVAGVYIPSTGVLDPYDLTIALAENAMGNGVDIKLNTEVVGFLKNKKNVTGVVTNCGVFNCKLVINAAGVYCDEIADLAGCREYTIHPRRGVELIFNKNISPGVNHCLAELIIPTPKTSKGGGVNPTVHGNVIWGPTAVETPLKNDIGVGNEEIGLILEKYKSMLSEFPKSKLIRYFAGVRAPTFTEDFIIRPAKWVDNFIHVAGIQSPGLASAPAIASYVVDIVKEKGFAQEEKNDFNPVRKGIASAAEMNLDELEEKIKQNPSWGNIVCTCEMISEAEIVESIHRGARSVDAVKRRTRAGMGSCQYSYCRLRIAQIISRELNIPLNQVVKESDDSLLFNGYVRGEKP